MLDSEPAIVDVEKIESVSDGRIRIKVYDVVYECFVHVVPEKPLYVILNGTKTRDGPDFKRWSWYPFIDGGMLNIADPMYDYYKKLLLGWYWGSDDTESGNFRHHVAIIAKKISKVMGSSNVIFYSSSGGCAASIQASSYFTNSMTVSINPQVVLGKFKYAKTFEEIVGVNLIEQDVFSRQNVIKYLETRGGESCNNHIIIQNIRSETDMIQYYELCKHFGVNPQYGICKVKNVVLWTYDSPSFTPHNAQENFSVYYAIRYLINNFDDAVKLQNFYRLINEFWYQNSVIQMSLDKIKSEQINISNIHVFESSQTIEECCLEKRKYKYNHVVLTDKLKPNTSYLIQIKDSTSESVKNLCICLKDSYKTIIIKKIMVPVGSKSSIVITTGAKTEGYQICIYPDIPGSSEDKEFNVKFSINSSL